MDAPQIRPISSANHANLPFLRTRFPLELGCAKVNAVGMSRAGVSESQSLLDRSSSRDDEVVVVVCFSRNASLTTS